MKSADFPKGNPQTKKQGKNKMRKFFYLVLSVMLLLACSACNSGDNGGSEQTNEPVKISIPSLTVDLYDPENKVDVNAKEISVVTDKNGRQLTNEEWLLNSKFSKEYIRSLGVGVYEFTYTSENYYGTIILTIEDKLEPNLAFEYQVPSVIETCDKIDLPSLIRGQDSYQDEILAEYSVSVNGEEREIVNGQVDFELGANYVYTAVVQKNDQEYTFKQEFRGETAQDIIERRRQVLIDKFLTIDGWQSNANNFVNYGDSMKALGTWQMQIAVDWINECIAEGYTVLEFDACASNGCTYLQDNTGVQLGKDTVRIKIPLVENKSYTFRGKTKGDSGYQSDIGACDVLISNVNLRTLTLEEEFYSTAAWTTGSGFQYTFSNAHAKESWQETLSKVYVQRLIDAGYTTISFTVHYEDVNKGYVAAYGNIKYIGINNNGAYTRYDLDENNNITLTFALRVIVSADLKIRAQTTNSSGNSYNDPTASNVWISGCVLS